MEGAFGFGSGVGEMKPDATLLRDDLMRDEGQRLKLYWDNAAPPRATIGYGRNMTDRGISGDEAMYMLINDITIAETDLTNNCPWWTALPEPASRGLANMAFNMGWPGLSAFKKMLAALQAGLFETAAQEAENSSWAAQVPNRAHRIATLFRNCI